MYPTLCPYPLGLYLTYIPKLLAQYITATLRLGGPNNVGELLYVKLISTDISVTVAQIKKFQKTRCIFFRILLLGGPSPPIQLVPNPFNWSPNTVFTDISVTVAQIKKIQKTKSTYFFILLLEGPHPANWSPTDSTGPRVFFHRYLQQKGSFWSFCVMGRGRLGEFTVCTVCIEKQKTTKNGQMAAGRVKMSERVDWKRSQKLLALFFVGVQVNFFSRHQRWVPGACCSHIFWKIGKRFVP